MPSACCGHYKLYRASWSKVRVSNILVAVILPMGSEKWVKLSTTTGERSLSAGVPTDLISDLSAPGVGGFLQELADKDLGAAVCHCSASLCGTDVEWVRAWLSNQHHPLHPPKPPQHQTLEMSLSGVFVTYRGEQCSGRGLLRSPFSFTLAMQVLWRALWITWGWIFLGYCRYQAS